jgi:hypothetical protein
VAGPVRCLPSNMTALQASYFANGACTGANVAMMLACNPPDLVRGFGAEIPIDAAIPPCATTFPAVPLFRPVAVPSPAVYLGSTLQDGGTSCEPTPYGGFQYYAAGAPVQMEEFPVVTLGPKGSGRYQPLVTSSEGRTLYVHSNLLYDTQTATVCRPEQLPGDGRTLCIPDSIAGLSSSDFGPYSDPACTNHLVAVEACNKAAPPAAEVSLPSRNSCGAVTFRKVLGLHAGPTYSLGAQFGPPGGQGFCAPAEPGTSVAYDLGGEVDPATLFPLLKREDL